MKRKKCVREIIKNIQNFRQQPLTTQQIERINKIFEEEIKRERVEEEKGRIRVPLSSETEP